MCTRWLLHRSHLGAGRFTSWAQNVQDIAFQLYLVASGQLGVFANGNRCTIQFDRVLSKAGNVCLH